MANSNGWGDGAANNTVGWGQGANNAIGWGKSHSTSWAGLTDIVGTTTPVEPTYDAASTAFFTSSGITNVTQKIAINDLVVGLKADGLWTNMKAIYPFVGGTASTHKWNLKDPRDLDAAYRLSFSGGWTHNANGITGNGVNAYAETYNNSAFSLGAYSRVSTSQLFLGFEIITQDNDCNPTNPYGLLMFGSQVQSLVYNISAGSAPFTKMYSVVDEGSILPNTINIYRNGADIGNTSPDFASWPRGGLNNYAIGASKFYEYDCDGNLSNTFVQRYSTANLAFVYFSDSILNATQNANLNTRIVAFQTALSRQV